MPPFEIFSECVNKNFMKVFGDQSQWVILSRLDSVLWDADSPIALFFDDEDGGEKFVNGMLVSHLQNHDIKNQGVVFQPGGDQGILYSLSEALLEFFPNSTSQEIASIDPDSLPEFWERDEEGGAPVHRILIIENFEQILVTPLAVQLKFCSLLRCFAKSKQSSVICLSENELADCFTNLPGFQTDAKNPSSPFTQLPGRKTLAIASAAATVMLILSAIFFFNHTNTFTERDKRTPVPGKQIETVSDLNVSSLYEKGAEKPVETPTVVED